MPKNKRVKISSVVKNQLPDFIRADFPLVGDFLAQYYTSLEGQGSTLDILQNIDKYIKVDELTDLVEETSLSSNVGIADNTISVDSTTGFPDSYGLIEIDSEIITYTGITTNSFTGCSRGFSGITTYQSLAKKDELVFSQSGITTHSSGSAVNNLSIRFLKQFFKKVKTQFSPGFEERTLDSDVNKRLFLKQSKDFYSSKGTNQSFEILFRALYGEDVEVVKPRDYLFIPSDADYKVSEQLVVEAIDGDPQDLINRTLFQDVVYGFPKATGSISDVEKIVRGEKTYYKLSLDYDHQLDEITENFSIHPSTKLVDPVSIGATTLSVDSTVGFGTTGTLIANFADGTFNTINYSSKSLTQFFDCKGVDNDLSSTQDLRLDAFAYGYSGVGTANVVKVKVTGVLSDLNLEFDGTYYNEVGNIIEPKGLGSVSKSKVTDNLLTNISTTYNVVSIELVDRSNFTYKLNLFNNHSFVAGDDALINDISCSIISLISSKEILIKGSGELDENVNYRIQRLLSKANLSNYGQSNIFTTNVQNSYLDNDDCTYITSASIPTYFNDALDIRDTSLSFSGTFEESTDFQILNHGLLTGERIIYVPGDDDNKLDITAGEYFVKKVDINTFKICRSTSNIANELYVSFSGTVDNNRFNLSDFDEKTIKSQKLIRKIQDPISTLTNLPTPRGKTGILVNGVEILNYKSNDAIHYGPIEEISVTSGGDDYDVINPPILSITDSTGVGVSAFCEVQGSIEKIDVVDGGFDYITKPTLKISGGNGSGCIAIPNLVMKEHSLTFDSTELGGYISTANNTIGFTTYHKFREGELITYLTDTQTAIAGLTTNAAYYCSLIDASTVALHINYQDAIAGLNTIGLGPTYGAGIHELKCANKKRILSSISIGSSGSGYTNKLTSVTSAGINTSNNTISIPSHGYKTGELVRYDSKSTDTISGLSTLTNYYVTVVDGGSFRLSQVGVGSTAANFYIKNKEYINLTSGGSGQHLFNYPPVTVTLVGNIGVSTFSGQNFNAELRPIVRGSIKSVYIVDGGVGYGSSDIINYNRQPTISLKNGKNAQLIPIIDAGGKLSEVIVLNKGEEYNSPPTLEVKGTGNGSKIIPILKNGTVDSVKVISSGIGYTSSDVSITVTPNGTGADFYSNPKTWTINSVERLVQNDQITTDDGIISVGLKPEYGLQYSHLYVPRKLRQTTYVKKTVADREVFVPDLSLENDIEEDSINHSPIIGWSYDGCPIYGPYGYTSASGGPIKILESGYSPTISSIRPNPLTSNGDMVYAEGFFVEDYVYSDDKDLDQHNGRFCKTPEFPNGVYAYFGLINPTARDSEGSFKNYRKPQFPYFIGNSFKHQPIEYNFESKSNQDDIDLNKTNLIRNTGPYNFLFTDTEYDYLVDPNNIQQQRTYVKSTTSGNLQSVGINTGGDGYKVGDEVVFEDAGSSGYGARSVVSNIKGKTITNVSIAYTENRNTEFSLGDFPGQIVGHTTSPHNLTHNESVHISGLSTSGITNNANVRIGVSTGTFKLFGAVETTLNTGIVTYFNLDGYVRSPYVKENDLLGIGTECVKVLNVDTDNSRVRVIRDFNSTIGAAHTHNSLVSQKPKTFTFFDPVTSAGGADIRIDRELYFNPTESVGLGTLSGVGIGSTLVFSNPGTGISEIFVPTKSLYFKDHGLVTGDTLTYNVNAGTAVSVSTNGIDGFALTDQQTVYAARISNDLIGIATSRVGLGSTGSFVGIDSTTTASTLYFIGIGTGVYHSLKTNYTNKITGLVSKSTVTVSTSSTHGLSVDDRVILDVKPGITTTVKVAYNDYNRRLVINPRTFTSSDVNTNLNTITIARHGYITGQKVIATATTSPGGLVDNGIYFVNVVDENKIKLSNTFNKSVNLNPEVINITSSSDGTISPINPPIILEKDLKIYFDLSDSSLSFTNNEVSYSAFDFNLYSDSLLKDLFVTSGESNDFNVSKTGRIGIDANANLTVKNVKEIDQTLYYNLQPINESLNTAVKTEIIRDTDNIRNSNSASFVFNELNDLHSIVGVGSTTFSIITSRVPKKLEYTSADGIFKYTTNSKNAKGPISKIEVTNSGYQYNTLPGISTIITTSGKNAILETKGRTIGRIDNVEISDIGFDYPVDKTLRPEANIPQLIKVDLLTTIDKIGISSVGKNYLDSPGLVLLDGLTKKEVKDIELDYELGDSHVTILKNTKALNNVTPTIIPIDNSNGISINNIDYNSGTKDVTVTIGASFSDAADYPFEVGKKVLIEGVSVGLGSTGKGYNSSTYDYTLFEILETDPNIGGTLGTVRYNLSNIIPDGEVPGTFKSNLSTGKIVAQEDWPIFDISLKTGNFDKGETVVSGDLKGTLQSWNTKYGYLRVSAIRDFEVGKSFLAESSGLRGTISEVLVDDSSYSISSSSIVKEGFKKNTGFLNDSLQRIFDSDYYQYFSYSLKSEVQYDKWKEPVSSLNHTAGFKKFSDLVIRTEPEVGVSTVQTGTVFEVINDLISIQDLNTVYDFDLVTEKTLEIDGKTISDEIVFESKILADYNESIGNRVLTVDDISGDFNNNARTDAFMSVDSFTLASVRYRKYITFIRDKRFTKERQILLVSALHDDSGNIFLNQYGRVETNTDLGEFGGDLGSYDMDIAGDDGRLLFFPKKFKFNNYDVSNVAFNISDSVTGVGSTGLGGIVNITSSTTTIPLGISTQHSIISFATTYRGSKVLVSYAASDASYWEHDEITLVHDGTNVDMIEYGQLSTGDVGSASGEPGLGTYSAYIAGGRVSLDLHPTVATASTYVANTVHVDFGNASSAGVGTTSLNTANLDSRYTAISASGSPSATTVAQYETETFNGAYYVVCVEDTTNSHYQISEVIVVDDGTTSYITEYAINQTVTNLGDFGATISGDNTLLTFTPIASANVQVRVFQAALRLVDEANEINEIDLTNATIDTGFGAYTATETDVKRAFDLKHRQLPIFKRDFVGSATTTVSLAEDTITLPDHYFVTGEELSYRYTGSGTTSAIEIASQSIPGYGTTDKMPSTVYAVKVDDTSIRLATSAENALKTTPTYLDITAVGVGTSHSFTSKKQNSRCILSIDNVIQSPIVATAVTTTISADVSATTDKIKLSGITSITGGDMLKIGSEIMKVDSVGLGATNVLLVTRPWMGTETDSYSSNTLITKVEGNYNIVDSTVNFFTAPVGLVPLSTTTNEPDERDWVGVATHSIFNGRSFMRSGLTGSAAEPYAGNYIFDDISGNFTGLTTEFTLQSDGSNIAGFSTSNAVVLVNQVAQGPQRYTGGVHIPGDYNLIESVGITSIQFTGSTASVASDPNSANVPLGGIIVSVGSTEGLGYQPLVGAGGTAVVSGLGTISSVSIGNSGSGYRSGIQTVVNVGVQTLSTGAPNIEFIGTAAISGGHIVSIAITNPGTGYTTTNPPSVVIDEPLSYDNMPLFYSSSSSGVGSQARANIVVGQGSSVIDFEITNQGYGYGETQVLTIGVGGTVGIPTNSSYSPSREFELTIQETVSDSFAGWTVGDFQVLDTLDSLFDGKTKSFALNLNGVQQTIQSKPGSNIDVEVALLIFINDILQVPDVGYTFKGGSFITFKEAPKEGDTSKILFYQGTGSVDVTNVDILETIKEGDQVKLYDKDISLEENKRTVTNITASDSIKTNLYGGPGITTDETFERALTWSRQTQDKFIDGKTITKDRPHYEPLIYPSTNIIQSVGVGSTVIYVSNIRTFFDNSKENYTGQTDIRIISQDSLVGASATAFVSAAGTVTSFDITNPGVGYTIAPSVSITTPVGYTTSQGARATATISGVGTVNAITVSYGGTTTGFAYTNTAAPAILIGEPKSVTSIETIENVSYSGDFGIISGISTTSVGVASTGIVFDLLLPNDSLFRNASIVGSALTVSGISTGYYFTVFNSNVGASVTSLYQDGTVVGIGTSFLDNVYEVAQVSIAQTMGIGIGLTYVAQVTVSVQDYNGLTGLGYSEFFGEYSWGRIDTAPRGKARVFTSYAGNSDGLVGITTSPIIERVNPLRYLNYNT